MNKNYIQLMLAGMSHCIQTAYLHSESFREHFCKNWCNNIEFELDQVYMASERTKVTVCTVEGVLVTDCISTEDFITWVEKQNTL